MRDGEYGCAMSHLNVYRRMIAENTLVACVLEDDAIPRKVLPRLLDWLENQMDASRPQVALISNHRGDTSKMDYHLERVTGGSYTDGYVITLPAARKILEKNMPIKCPSDTWTLWQRRKWIELYQASPEGVNQEWCTTEGYASDVTASGDVVVDVQKMSALGRIIWKVKRAVGSLICFLFLH